MKSIFKLVLSANLAVLALINISHADEIHCKSVGDQGLSITRYDDERALKNQTNLFYKTSAIRNQAGNACLSQVSNWSCGIKVIGNPNRLNTRNSDIVGSTDVVAMLIDESGTEGAKIVRSGLFLESAKSVCYGQILGKALDAASAFAHTFTDPSIHLMESARKTAASDKAMGL